MRVFEVSFTCQDEGGKGHATRPCGNHDFYDEQGLFLPTRRDRLKIITDSNRILLLGDKTYFNKKLILIDRVSNVIWIS